MLLCSSPSSVKYECYKRLFSSSCLLLQSLCCSSGIFFPFNFLPTQGPRLWCSALDTVQNCFWVCAHPFKGGLKHIPEQSFLFAVGGRKSGGWCLILCLLPLSCSGLDLVSLPTWTAYWAALESYHHMGSVWEVLYHCFLVSRFAYEMHASLSLYPFPPW